MGGIVVEMALKHEVKFGERYILSEGEPSFIYGNAMIE